MRPSTVLRVFLACLILFNLFSEPFFAQQPGASAAALNIVIVEGDGAINNVRQRVNREQIVQVEDSNHKPVAGAVVLFFLPDQGASGTFPDGSKMMMATTNSQGRVTVRSIKPNQIAGPMAIRVTASYQGLTASAVINQTNAVAAGAAAGAGLGAAKLWIILGIAGGAAAAGGIYYATHNGGSTAVTITPGTPAVGGP